jgi:hypothetical protein
MFQHHNSLAHPGISPDYGGGGGGGGGEIVGRSLGVGATPCIGCFFFPGRVFSNSSVILCFTMFWMESPNEGDAVTLG